MAEVAVRDVFKSYGSVEVIHGVNVDIADGEFVVLVGPSGCGKSTLLRMIAGLERPSGGSISIDGDTPDAARKAKRIGFIPPSPALLPWRTVEANARLLLDLNSGANPPSPPDPIELLERVGLGEALHHHEGHLRQRLEQLRAVAMGIPIAVRVVDEPPGHGVDTEADLAAAEAWLRDREGSPTSGGQSPSA